MFFNRSSGDSMFYTLSEFYESKFHFFSPGSLRTKHTFFYKLSRFLKILCSNSFEPAHLQSQIHKYFAATRIAMNKNILCRNMWGIRCDSTVDNCFRDWYFIDDICQSISVLNQNIEVSAAQFNLFIKKKASCFLRDLEVSASDVFRQLSCDYVVSRNHHQYVARVRLPDWKSYNSRQSLKRFVQQLSGLSKTLRWHILTWSSSLLRLEHLLIKHLSSLETTSSKLDVSVVLFWTNRVRKKQYVRSWPRISHMANVSTQFKMVLTNS